MSAVSTVAEELWVEVSAALESTGVQSDRARSTPSVTAETRADASDMHSPFVRCCISSAESRDRRSGRACQNGKNDAPRRAGPSCNVSYQMTAPYEGPVASAGPLK